jgi:hypothetical protein
VKAATVLVTAGMLLAALAACGDGDDKKADPTPPAPQCVGKDTPGSTHVISSGPGPLPGGGSAIVQETHFDKTPPTAQVYLTERGPSDKFLNEVSVGGTITAKGTKYTVVEICAGRVQLVKG